MDRQNGYLVALVKVVESARKQIKGLEGNCYNCDTVSGVHCSRHNNIFNSGVKRDHLSKTK